MTTASDEKQRLTASLVGACVANEAIHQRFMNAYRQASQDDVKAYLMDEFGLPEDLADEILAKEGQELSNHIGQLICDYLW